MKKTFTINISGSIFHIDEDAFEKLQRYLQMLNRHFNAIQEGQEILQDIEARIAELLIEKTNNKTEVVTTELVDEVIVRMGRPEDFLEVEEEEASTKTTTPPSAPFEPITRRRLYRDGENRVLGGISSGLGAYFNMDPVIWRIIFVLLFFVIGPFNILLYLILWIAVPKARTTAQRLEMRGKEATVSNIEKSIKEEVKDIGDNYNRFMNTPEGEKGITRADRLGDTLNGSIRVILRVAVLILGIILIGFAIFSLIGFIASMAIGHSFLHGGPWNFGGPDINMGTLMNHLISPEAYTISVIALSLLAGIPLLALLFLGTKLIFRYHTNNRAIGLVSVALWLVALITLVFVGVGQISNFSKQTSQTTTQKVECSQCKTIYLQLNDDLYESLIDDHISLDRMRVAEINGKEKLLGHPSFTIEKSNNDEFLLQIKKRSRGNSTTNAQHNLEQINYNFSQKDSTIMFDPYYLLADKAKWRYQEVDLILKVPQGKTVFLSEPMKTIIHDIENVNNTWDGDMVNKFWTMTPEGLALKDSLPSPSQQPAPTKQNLFKNNQKKISFHIQI
jgi:phage shock protein PspC (stress-responsive transcriptional regulator)